MNDCARIWQSRPGHEAAAACGTTCTCIDDLITWSRSCCSPRAADHRRRVIDEFDGPAGHLDGAWGQSVQQTAEAVDEHGISARHTALCCICLCPPSFLASLALIYPCCCVAIAGEFLHHDVGDGGAVDLPAAEMGNLEEIAKARTVAAAAAATAHAPCAYLAVSADVVTQCVLAPFWLTQVLAHVPPMRRERVAQLVLAPGYLRRLLDLFRVRGRREGRGDYS